MFAGRIDVLLILYLLSKAQRKNPMSLPWRGL